LQRAFSGCACRCRAIVDTGICNSASKDIWRKIFSDTMRGLPVTHVIATHLHPDHLGCAGWLTRLFDVDLWMTREEYMLGRLLVADTGKPAPEEAIRFYTAAGFSEENLQEYRDRFGFFGRMVSRLPESYVRIHDNDRLALGEYSWRVLIGRGHSPEHACLYCEQQNLLISGDQVLPTISANVSVWPTEPAANPMQHWLESLAALREQIPDDVLVLPAHGKPFRGAHNRIDAIIANGDRRGDRPPSLPGRDRQRRLAARHRRRALVFENLTCPGDQTCCIRTGSLFS
jgi:glyoxylase-like metal-dependent hydrolase (beta-lactamase superfamily II)